MTSKAPTNISLQIHQMRDHQVLLDTNLARLYAVDTGALIRSVR